MECYKKYITEQIFQVENSYIMNNWIYTHNRRNKKDKTKKISQKKEKYYNFKKHV